LEEQNTSNIQDVRSSRIRDSCTTILLDKGDFTNLNVIKLSEHGYEWAALGFSLSYNSTVERAKQLLPKYAWGKVPGENKFLRVMWVWLDVDFPRLIWPEADQYKVSTTTLSESTIHTLGKRLLTQEDFEIEIDVRMLDIVNEKISLYQNKQIDILTLKSHLPEGFLQRRVWNMNYANLQNLICQRTNHKVSLWDKFIDDVVSQLDHPEFVLPNFKKEI
jgi:hypothetical protein